MGGLSSGFKVLITLVMLFMVSTVEARTTTHGGGGWGPISTTRRFGIGIDGGSPYYGINIKYFMTHGSALQLTVGGHDYQDRWLGVKGEYLIHPFVLARGPSLDIPFYIGGGFGLAFKGDRRPLVNMHIPVGLAFQLHPIPIDLFLQLEPGFDLFYWFTVGFGAGIRIFF